MTFAREITHQKHLAQSGRSTLSAVNIFNILRVFTKEPIREQEIKLGLYEYDTIFGMKSTTNLLIYEHTYQTWAQNKMLSKQNKTNTKKKTKHMPNSTWFTASTTISSCCSDFPYSSSKVVSNVVASSEDFSLSLSNLESTKS